MYWLLCVCYRTRPYGVVACWYCISVCRVFFFVCVLFFFVMEDYAAPSLPEHLPKLLFPIDPALLREMRRTFRLLMQFENGIEAEDASLTPKNHDNTR